MSAAFVAPDLLIDNLEYFVRQALQRAHGQFLASRPQDRVRITIAGQTCDVAESEQFLMPSVRHCLASEQTHPDEGADIAVFLDYSGWHIGPHSGAMFPPNENMLLLDQRLAKRGMRASFGQDSQTWDIFDQPGIAATTPWEPTSPLAFFCKWIAELDDKTMVHAASLARNGVGALLVGHGGAGKSGTVVGGLLSGFQSAGDDYILISADHGHRAHAVYRTVKQDVAGLDRLGLPRTTTLNWQNKAVFRPESLGANAIIDTAPINVILSPSTGAARTRFHPIDPAEVFKTLSISTLKQLGGSTAQVFRACAALVRDVPCFGVELSSDKDEIAVELTKFLGSLPC
jgi:hypothetical protein